MFCRSCGTENDESAKFCRGCGLPIVPASEIRKPESEEIPEPEEAAEPNYGQSYPNGQPNYGQPYPNGQPNYGQPYPVNHYSGGSIACLVLGIISVVCCCTFFAGIGCGIAAIIVYATEVKKGEKNGMLTAGLVLGIIGAALAVISLIWFFVSGNFTRLMDAIRTGRLSEYFRQFTDYNYPYWS